MTGWIDVHAHYLTPRYVAECHTAGHGRPDGMPGMPQWSIDEAQELMAATGVGAAVLSISSPGVHFGDDSTSANFAARDLASHVNDVGASIVADQPARFGLAAVLPLPDVDGAVAELFRAFDDLDADAVALKTNVHGRYLSDEAFAPVLAELDRRRAVVMLHPTSPVCWQAVSQGRPRPMLEFIFETTRCVVDLLLTGALDRYAGIRWIVPHAGAVLPVVAQRVTAFTSSFGGTPVDVVGALGKLYYDLAGMPLPVALDALLAIVEPDRLLYGSDFPFTPAPLVGALTAALAEAPALSGADLTLGRESAGATLFPRLSRAATA